MGHVFSAVISQPASPLSNKMAGKGHGEFHSQRFDDSNTGVTLTTNSPNVMDHDAHLSGTKAICIHGAAHARHAV
ncbi:hypothetical protein HMPREF9577_02137 [Cutibacterium acnes HL110PA3]|nr:hypothetical protein HMPREF9577_02137 [Cutibacterium acnes HL110PA3]